MKGLIEKAEEAMTKMAPHSSASTIGSLSPDFEMRTLRTLQELFNDDKGGKARAEKKPSFDLGIMDEESRQKLAEFNTEYDNTLLQMGDESEQILMDNGTLLAIVNDPDTKAR